MSRAILALNAGSSSLKFVLYSTDALTRPMITGKVSGIGRAPEFAASDADGASLDKGALCEIANDATHEAIIELLLDWIGQHLTYSGLVSIGHRVVHGGREFIGPVLIDETVLKQLDELIPLAPLHQPHNLAVIRAVAKWRPDLPQVACFDTSFHRSQDRLAQLFALPRELSDQDILRYGFHGLSYEYIASILPDHLGDCANGRVVVSHLGNGASMCAMKNRKSVATSMGFTALDGLMMGRRCGALDAGVVLHLMQQKGMSEKDVEELLYRRSGLLGVSGISNNMLVLEQSTDARAREAIDLYCYRAASVLSGLVPAIGGLDALVFTAGIGENSAQVRRLICERFSWLGVELDPLANDNNELRISPPQSRIDILVLPTNEEAMIANAANTLIEGLADKHHINAGATSR